MLDTGRLRKSNCKARNGGSHPPAAATSSTSSSSAATAETGGGRGGLLHLPKLPLVHRLKLPKLRRSRSNTPSPSPLSHLPTPINPVNGVTAPKQTEAELEREKKRLARKKERRATLILGLIMGSFIACWFPFFFLYSISPVCPICEEEPDSPCCVQAWGFSFAFWLGYSNSALNPVIYTIFNKDFRRAFKRILFK